MTPEPARSLRESRTKRIPHGGSAARWRKRLREAFTAVALVVASLAGSLLVMEGGLRLLGVSHAVFTEVDPTRGWALSPGMSFMQRKEGEQFIRINSRGLRDIEHDLAKPSGTLRIAVLGDSMVEALQVALEDTFWSVMRRTLDECTALNGTKVEVINFGVQGYGTAQELLTLRNHVWQYQPDIVLLAFTTGNDIRNNSRALENDPNRPYIVLRDGNLELDDRFLQSNAYKYRASQSGRLITAAVEYSRLLQVLKMARQHLRPSRESPGPTGAEVGLTELVYLPPHGAWVESWRVTEEMLRTMAREVYQHGARFAVAVLSSGIQVHPDEEVRRGFMRDLGIDDLFYPDKRLEAFGRTESITVWPLAPILYQKTRERRQFLHGFDSNLGGGHWNENGHRLAGEILAGRMCGMLADQG